MGNTWKHAANEWADTAVNALEWLRTISAGLATPEEAIAFVEADIRRCRYEQPMGYTDEGE